MGRVVLTRRGLPRLSGLLPGAADPGAPGDDLDAWLDERDVAEGTPFLISPDLEYDIGLNRYFLAPVMAGAAPNTRLAAAGDLCRFLRFLDGCRGGRSWRDAGEGSSRSTLRRSSSIASACAAITASRAALSRSPGQAVADRSQATMISTGRT
jgi:hypothetical protein